MGYRMIVVPPETRTSMVAARKGRGWTKMDLAVEAEVAQSSVARIEAGRPVGVSLVHTVLRALGIDLPADADGLGNT